MDSQTSGNGPSTQIKKCPYYDPATRETVKPGKTCPEYNTPTGCPCAHPWEFEEWDGETPFSVPAAVTNVDHSLSPPTPTQSSTNEAIMQSRVGDLTGDMEIDDRPTPVETALIRRPETATRQTKTLVFIPPSQDPSSAPSLSLQKEAVEQFLTHLISAVYHYRIESAASAALAKFKADYKSLCKSYTDAEKGEELLDIISPGEKAAWVAQRERMTNELEEAEDERWAWIDGLVSMDGKPNPISLRIGYGEDAEMKDAASAVGSEVVLTKEEDLIVDALNHHRAGLHRGAVGERVANLRARMDRIRATMEKKSARHVSAGRPTDSSTNADKDTDMKDTERPPDPKTLFRIATDDLKRLEDLQEMAENMSSPIDVAEDWGMADVKEEWFNQEMRTAIKEITREFIRQEQEVAGAKAAEESSTQGQASKPKEIIGEMKQTLEDLTTIQDTSENLLRIIGPMEIFDENHLPHFSFVLQNISKASETLESDLQALLTPVSDRLIALTMPPTADPASPTSLSNRTAEFHERHLNTHTPLQEARKPQLLSPHLPSQKEVQGHQMASWYSEYEELRELAGSIVGPIVARTDTQEDMLMEFERGRRASVGTSVHGEGGGLVNTHVSVEGTMG